MKKREPSRPKYALRVKKSSAGLGIYAGEPIKRQTKILEYVGYIITNEEADRKGGKYLFEILKSKFTIDGTPRWNTARYFNHACKPNAEAVWYGNHVWICAKKNIKPGEEITYNYGKAYFDDYIKPYGCRCASCVAERSKAKK